jgi:hypothetical protein
LGLVFLFFVAKGIAQVPFDELDISRNCDPSTDMCIQAQCDDSPRTRITTHPDRPVNVLNPGRTNFFNWRDTAYPILLSLGSRLQYPILSPFAQGGNTNTGHFIDLDKRDIRPEDGWEVLKYDFGGRFSEAGINTHTVSIPYLVLYNRFLGKMRVFVARGDEAYTTNFANIRVEFKGTNVSSLLDLHKGALTPLDAPFIKGAIQVPANVLNNPGKCIEEKGSIQPIRAYSKFCKWFNAIITRRIAGYSLHHSGSKHL